MLQIYSAEVCPFAQRTRALLTHLGEPFEVHEIDLRERDPRFLEISPTGKVPMLLDGDFKLYESQVINDYLADKQGWGPAYSSDPRLCARQKLAMKQWDAVVLPAFYESLMKPESFDDERRRKVEGELDELNLTLQTMGAEVECLLAFHLASFWARMDWLRRYTPIAELIDQRPALRDWLDRAVGLDAVQGTLPEREWTVRRYEERYVQGKNAA
ncbi:MAG: glutathione S-transferase family protein [Acidobacteriota bacterium]